MLFELMLISLYVPQNKDKIDGNRNSYKIIDLWISEMTNDTIRK